MADTKRKCRDDKESKRGRMKKKKASSKKEDKPTRKRGPGLPNVLRREINLRNPATAASNSDDEFESDGAAANDVYEYEEALAQEESKKNKRFDPVENYEYELPEDFEDEDIASDDGSADDKDDEKHSRMLEEITGLPADAFEGKRQRNDIIVSEAYPESEYNPSRDILEGESHISIQDLLDPLRGKSGFHKIRKDVSRMERKSTSLNAPLPRPDQEKAGRKAAYEFTKKYISKWEGLVKRNREARTLYFREDTDVGFSTVGAIAHGFQPRTDFEKGIASLVNDKDIVEAHGKDGGRLLELNEISAEDVRGQQNRLAKMRSLLFHHEMRAKRIKKIKSKTYHRLHKKDRQKATVGQMELDEEAAKEIAEKQEFKRAEERLTLKHKNTSKFAKRAIGRGLNVQDEGTRAAISEQLHQHALLTRKMRSMKDSSDESSEADSAELSSDSDDDGPSVLRKAKRKTLEVLERDEELPNSGVLSLPFMVRGLEKKKAAADGEARLALQEYESSLKQLGDKNEEEIESIPVSSGRMVFGNSTKQATTVSEDKVKSDNYYGNSDSEEDQGLVEDGEGAPDQRTSSQKAVNIDPSLFREESEIKHDQLFESFKDTFKDAQPHKTYEVAIIAPNARKKTNPTSGKQTELSDRSLYNDAKAKKPASADHDVEEGNADSDTDSGGQMVDVEEGNADSDTDSGGQMVDGILSSGPRLDYELPSQEELLHRAFAGDDVEGDFVKEKEEALNEENPEPEKPVLLPGWGQWTHIQKKKGLPSWMLREHDKAKKQREETLKKRKDASLEHVIISEKLDKKTEKLHTKTLPYPYTSKDVFEQSIRMPIGPDFNPVTAVGPLNRPEIMKKSGVSIKPIEFEDINSHEKTEGHKTRRLKPRKGGKGSKGVSHVKAKSKGGQLKPK